MLTTDTPQLAADDLILAKNMAELLHRHYPGHLWAVTAQSEKGIATIRNLLFSGEYGYILNLPKIHGGHGVLDRRIVRAGGEILERYRTRRARFDEDAYAAMPTNFAGRFEYDK